MNTFGVIDFETTGLSPNSGDRATEVAVAILSDGKIVDRYQSLINPERSIPFDIQSLTGITDVMVRAAPKTTKVMKELHNKIGNIPLIAHNASFDSKFLSAEYSRAGLKPQGKMICSMLLARRMYTNSPNHKLGTLVRYLSLPTQGVYHRAMADAEMTAYLVAKMIEDLKKTYGLAIITPEIFLRLQCVAKNNFSSAVEKEKPYT